MKTIIIDWGQVNYGSRYALAQGRTYDEALLNVDAAIDNPYSAKRVAKFNLNSCDFDAYLEICDVKGKKAGDLSLTHPFLWRNLLIET